MNRPRLYTRTIHKACAQIGGPAALAARLSVGVNTVFNWLEGLEEAPAKAFLECVDIVLAAEAQQTPPEKPADPLNAGPAYPSSRD